MAAASSAATKGPVDSDGVFRVSDAPSGWTILDLIDAGWQPGKPYPIALAPIAPAVAAAAPPRAPHSLPPLKETRLNTISALAQITHTTTSPVVTPAKPGTPRKAAPFPLARPTSQQHFSTPLAEAPVVAGTQTASRAVSALKKAIQSSKTPESEQKGPEGLSRTFSAVRKQGQEAQKPNQQDKESETQKKEPAERPSSAVSKPGPLPVPKKTVFSVLKELAAQKKIQAEDEKKKLEGSTHKPVPVPDFSNLQQKFADVLTKRKEKAKAHLASTKLKPFQLSEFKTKKLDSAPTDPTPIFKANPIPDFSATAGPIKVTAKVEMQKQVIAQRLKEQQEEAKRVEEEEKAREEQESAVRKHMTAALKKQKSEKEKQLQDAAKAAREYLEEQTREYEQKMAAMKEKISQRPLLFQRDAQKMDHAAMRKKALLKRKEELEAEGVTDFSSHFDAEELENLCRHWPSVLCDRRLD